MSLTNDQITAKNFKEFYKAIRPYLNGSFPTPIANKFDKANMYSTDEQIVGRWIDGKPLYQKTFTISSMQKNGYEDVLTGIDHVQTISKSYRRMQGAVDADDFWYNSGAFVNVRAVAMDNGVLRITNCSSESTLTDITITAQYTKTTDTAMDIGSDTDYSTTEKIIGTWIDGKPLYQVTVELNYNKANVNEKNFDDILPSGIENVIECISNYETTDSFNKTITSALPKLDNYSASVYWTSNMPKGLIVCLGDTEKARVNKIYATVKYTKTTD